MLPGSEDGIVLFSPVGALDLSSVVFSEGFKMEIFLSHLM